MTSFARAHRGFATSRFRFPIVFFALLGVSWLVYELALPAFDWLQSGTVQLVLLGSSIIGLQASAVGSVVTFGGKFSFDVERGCTGIAVAFALASAILAYPAPKKARLLGVLVGVPFVFVVNIARLVTMGWAGVRSPDLFDLLHLFVWQVMVILMAGLGFYAWVRLNARGGDKLRTVAMELARAFGIFLLAFFALWLIGLYGGILAYLRTFDVTVSIMRGLLGMRWRMPHNTQAAIDFGIYPYFTWIGFVSLFLATPRIRWAKKARGAFFLLSPIFFFTYALYITICLNSHMTETEVSVLDILFDYGVPIVTWLLWARGSWKAPGRYTCPTCSERHDDIIGHVKAHHPFKTGKILDQVRSKYPELAAATSRGKARARRFESEKSG